MKQLWIALVLTGIIGGCASGGVQLDEEAGQGSAAPRALSLLKAELAALEQPKEVDDQLWASLCAELERAVAAGAPAAQSAGRTASQADQPLLSSEYSPRIFHGENRLQTYHVLTGDYDENGEVNAADLVPLSQYFLESALPATQFPADSRRYVVDGDSNGEINISDVTVIGQHFQERAVAYSIYASENIAADFPHEAHDSLIEPLHSVPFTGIHADEEKRRLIEFELPGQRYSHYWLRIETEDGEALPSALAFHADGAEPYVARFIEPWTQLSYDSTGGQVVWSNRLAGDGNSNGEINISDITVIGTNIGAEIEMFYGAEPGQPALIFGDPDMNRDLEVNMHDLLLVQSYFNTGYDGYKLYHSESATDLPAHPWADETLEPVFTGHIHVEDGNSFELGPDAAGYLWLRAYRGDQLGPVSAMLEL